MIKSWRHKGLKRFFETGNTTGIQVGHTKRLKIILQRLEAAVGPEDMNTPGMRFHHLRGDLKGYYSVVVNQNWRVIFQFDGQDAIFVDYCDYH